MISLLAARIRLAAFIEIAAIAAALSHNYRETLTEAAWSMILKICSRKDRQISAFYVNSPTGRYTCPTGWYP
jgi:hypothetical protein